MRSLNNNTPPIMKTLLTTIAAGLFVLPATTLEAKSYGGFSPGLTFKRKVTKVISTATSGFSTVAKKAPIPASVPKLKKGEVVTFKIGKKGELSFAGTSIPFKSDGGTSNVYNKVIPTKGFSDTAVVYKDSRNKPTGAALNYVRTNRSNPLQPKVNSVTYSL
jgi:hypothetical protein